MERLTTLPAMYDSCSALKDQGHVMYRQQECCNLPAGGDINYKLGGNYRHHG